MLSEADGYIAREEFEKNINFIITPSIFVIISITLEFDKSKWNMTTKWENEMTVNNNASEIVFFF